MILGWIKQFGGLRQLKPRGRENVSAVFGLHVIAHNLTRQGNILKPVAEVACARVCPEMSPGGPFQVLDGLE